MKQHGSGCGFSIGRVADSCTLNDAVTDGLSMPIISRLINKAKNKNMHQIQDGLGFRVFLN